MRACLVLFLAACGARTPAPASTEPAPEPSTASDATASSGAAASSAPATSPGASEASTSGPAASALLEVDCAGTSTDAFGPFDASCDDVTDCAMVRHRLDCCGSYLVHGVRRSELPRFEAEEARCEATVALCRCMAAPDRADDGSEQVRAPATLECIAHRCTTRFAP